MMSPIPILFVGSEDWQVLTFSVNQVELNIKRDRNQFPDKVRRNKAFDGYISDPNKPVLRYIIMPSSL